MREVYIAVVGAGASGLMAAYCAARKLYKSGVHGVVALLEGNVKIGKKLLATGNGRCNLTNLNLSPQSYHGDNEAAAEILSKYTPSKIIDEFYKMGLVCNADNEGRVYPNNLQAAAVLRALRFSCEEFGVKCICDFNVFSAIKSGENYIVKSENGEEIKAKKLIIASGGMASPKHSCGMNGYDVAKQFGHSIVKCEPALTSMKSSSKMLKSIKGMRCKAKATLLSDNKEIYSENGEVIFSDTALSGICIFGLSTYLLTLDNKSKAVVKLDLAEKFSYEDVKNYLKNVQVNHSELEIINILSGLINMKVGEELIKSLPIDKFLPVSTLKPAEIEKIAMLVKNLEFEVTKNSSWDMAQITAGGIPLSEIDLFTMESKNMKNLYFAGEILNIHGDCGGYNLHWAWTSGIIAGESAGNNIVFV